MKVLIILIFICIIFIFIEAIINGIFKILRGIYDSFSKSFAWGKKKYKQKKDFDNRRKKYCKREIDYKLNLFCRNIDIIDQFYPLAVNESSQVERVVIACLVEICLAENKKLFEDSNIDLYSWRSNVPYEWKDLADDILNYYKDGKETRKREAREQAEQEIAIRKEQAEQEIAIRKVVSSVGQMLVKREAGRNNPQKYRNINNGLPTKRKLLISDIALILNLDEVSWKDKEKIIMEVNTVESPIPLIEVASSSKEVLKLNSQISAFNEQLKKDLDLQIENRQFFKNLIARYETGDKQSVVDRLNFLINSVDLPPSIPRAWTIDFDEEQSICIVEIQLPDVVYSEVFKLVRQKSGLVMRSLSKKEKKELVPKIQPALILRIAKEIFVSDFADKIKLLVVNGWIEFHDPKNGNLTKEYVSSLMVERNQINDLNLNMVDPIKAFENLKGKSAGMLIDVIPIVPLLTMNKEDKRFIDTKFVLDALELETNLAAMDWQDFESLIAELFQKEFAKPGVEVKVTQASRDRGVDAVIFDPDPIKGGKFIVQAKRYTNTVDVSAVRDLCAVVKKEGASRGILVTTSGFGADAYAFANNEPITLLNGAQLLGLLEKHNYRFRINIEEAKELMSRRIKY